MQTSEEHPIPFRDKNDGLLWCRNGRSLALEAIEAVSPQRFHQLCSEACQRGARLVSLTVLSSPNGAPTQRLLAVLADDGESRLGWCVAELGAARSYPSLTAQHPQAQAFERELWEQHGIEPLGHPWLKPLRRHADLEELRRHGDLELLAGRSAATAAPHPFFRVDGAGIHEVAVGPVHAGVIEPGHFRFQCHGEKVLHLEIQLGYQHRGAEALLLRSTAARRLLIAESIAGDTAVGHGWAHCAALEALSGVEVSLTAQAIRAIALELERLANHVGDLSALCNDVGYLPGSSWFGRLRGEFLNLLMELSGNRFGRGLLVPGGVRFGIEAAARRQFLTRLELVERDLCDVAELTFSSPSIESRFEHTGIVGRDAAEALGLVGPAARASGCDRDARRDHPSGMYRYALIPVARLGSGDVMARAMLRWLEVQRSLTFVTDQLRELPDGPLSVDMPPLRRNVATIALIEGWRGEIAHLATTDADGRLATYKIIDPSFHNWFGLAMAQRDNPVSDFPLNNKSFNLSYAGHDL